MRHEAKNGKIFTYTHISFTASPPEKFTEAENIPFLRAFSDFPDPETAVSKHLPSLFLMDLERAEIPRTLSVDQEPQVRKNAFAGSSARIQGKGKNAVFLESDPFFQRPVRAESEKRKVSQPVKVTGRPGEKSGELCVRRKSACGVSSACGGNPRAAENPRAA